MDLIFTNDGLYFVCYGNDLTFGWVKFHGPSALPFLCWSRSVCNLLLSGQDLIRNCEQLV